ncbi:MAG TPA: hypothetical protein VKZ63_02490 [Kofleriaceae bacterium]|nr:hypothetical protein [Kofleriaceae bacterium]
MPIRTALVALLLCLCIFSLRPRESGASREAGEPVTRPAAALVAPPGDDKGRAAGDRSALGPYGLAALVAAGFVPVVVLIGRRRARSGH